MPQAVPVLPQQWRCQWSSAASAAPEARLYDLNFGSGGTVEGRGEGRYGAWDTETLGRPPLGSPWKVLVVVVVVDV